jgi:hypothetical protein
MVVESPIEMPADMGRMILNLRHSDAKTKHIDERK